MHLSHIFVRLTFVLQNLCTRPQVYHSHPTMSCNLMTWWGGQNPTPLGISSGSDVSSSVVQWLLGTGGNQRQLSERHLALCCR